MAATSSESLPVRRRRAKRIESGLRKLYPDADCALIHGSPLELLIATILSAQSTDDTVNKVMPHLMAAYPDASAIASAPAPRIEKLIYPTGFFRQKTKSVQGACRLIVEAFDGAVPRTMAELITLPGVARKTANVVLGTAYGIAEGFVVDTHVGRLATRLALTWTSKDSKDAVKIEKDLMAIFPQTSWTFLGHALVWHGRKVCDARKPDCAACTLAKDCPSAGAVDIKPPARKSGKKAAPRKSAKSATRKSAKKPADRRR